jgi:hypothetical protein
LPVFVSRTTVAEWVDVFDIDNIYRLFQPSAISRRHRRYAKPCLPLRPLAPRTTARPSAD